MIDRRTFLKGSAAWLMSGFPLSARASTASVMKPIPASGENIPVIGMGTWITFNIGKLAGLRDQRAQVLSTFFDFGGGMIDSSPMYGSSEAVLGYALNKNNKQANRNRLFAASKIWTSSDDGLEQFNDSLRLWGLQKFELFQVHNIVNFKTHYRTLQQLKEEGRINYLGITTSHRRMHDEFEAIMKTHRLDFVQLTYNITHRSAEDRLLKVAQDRGIAVIANRPYDGGALMDTFKSRPLPAFATSEGITSWADYLLKFVVSHPAITCAIPATSRVAHMRENMRAGQGKLPDQALRTELRRYIETLA